MAKSRLTLLLPSLLPPLLLAASAGAAAEPETIEQAMERQRTELRIAIGIAPCPPAGTDGEIVVCGRRGPSPHRVTGVDMPPERFNRFGAARSAMNTGTSSCSTVGANQRCSGGLNVFQAGAALLKVGRHILGRDD